MTGPGAVVGQSQIKTAEIVGTIDDKGNTGYRCKLGRADDMVKLNIRPAEAESMIAARRSDRSSVTETELFELCAVHLGNYERSGRVVLRHELLLTTSVGEIERKELREPFRVGRDKVAAN